MISCPKSGGKEIIMRITIGISQPAGRARTCCENGRRRCEAGSVLFLRQGRGQRTSTTLSWWIVIMTVRTMIAMRISQQTAA